MMADTHSYDPKSPDDVTRVRFWTGQTVNGESLLTDEEINFAISEAGGYQGAVIMCFDLMIAKLTKPDFRADWLQVSHGEAIKSFERQQTKLRFKWGLPSMVTGVVHVYRADSLQTEAPDWSADA